MDEALLRLLENQVLILEGVQRIQIAMTKGNWPLDEYDEAVDKTNELIRLQRLKENQV